jgi:hypothetical protein
MFSPICTTSRGIAWQCGGVIQFVDEAVLPPGRNTLHTITQPSQYNGKANRFLFCRELFRLYRCVSR